MNADRIYRMQRMGSINASSTAGTSAGMGGGNSVPSGAYAGSTDNNVNWGNIAQSAASIANTGKSVVTGVLQAEAAQNAINAQKNFTSALTPGVITIGLAVLAYVLISRK